MSNKAPNHPLTIQCTIAAVAPQDSALRGAFFAYRKKLKASVHPRTLHRALWTGGRHAEDCVPTQSEETT